MQRSLRSRFIRGLLSALVLVAAGATVQAQTVISFARLSSQAHNAYLDPLIAAFEAANPDVRVEAVESAGDGYEGLAQTALLGLAAGNPPDLVQVGFTFLETLVSSGAPLPLDPFISASSFDTSTLVPGMLGLGELNGQHYIVPIGTSVPIMYYNVDLFRAAGLDPDAPPTTWEEARVAAQALKDAGYQGILWGWSITGNWLFQTMLESAGGRLAVDQGNQHVVTFADDAGERTLEYLRSLAADGLMPVTENLVQTFVSGQLGMLVDSSFQRVNTPAQTPAEVRLAAIPLPEGGEARLPAGGNGVMLFSRDPVKQQAAWRFLEYLMGPEAGRIVAETSGYTPTNAAIIEVLAAEYADDGNYQAVLQQADKVVPWHAWPGQNGTRIAQVLKDMQHAVLLERSSPRQALDEAADEVTRLLRR